MSRRSGCRVAVTDSQVEAGRAEAGRVNWLATVTQAWFAVARWRVTDLQVEARRVEARRVDRVSYAAVAC
jgi:hypothetical protein